MKPTDKADRSKAAQRLRAKWMKRIERERDIHKDWRDGALTALNAYYPDDKTTFNMHYSNVQVLSAAICSNAPRPVAQRRFLQHADGARFGATIIERGISFFVDQDRFIDPLEQAIEHALAGACATVRVKKEEDLDVTIYSQEQVEEEGLADNEDLVAEKDGTFSMGEIADQRLRLEFFSYDHFGWMPCKSWDDVLWFYYAHDLTPEEINREYGARVEAGKASENERSMSDAERKLGTCRVYEVLDRQSRKIIHICEQYPGVLRVEDDPFGLDDFFDCPKPLYTQTKHERLEPVPDYEYYREIANKCEALMKRIMKLIKAVRAGGWVDGELEIQQLSEVADGDYIQLENVAELLERTGARTLGDLFHHVPVNDYIVVLQQLREHVEFLKRQAYEINGISDIVRGATRASETAQAQTLKGQWANIRMVRKQNAMMRFVRAIFRIMSEYLGEQFTPDVLSRMCAMPIEQVQAGLEVIGNDVARAFQVDVETDSTIAKDEMEDRRSRQEMVNALVKMLQVLMPQVVQGSMNVQFAKQLLVLTVKGYPHSRDVEEQINGIDETVKQFQQFQQQMQQMQQAIQQRDQAIQQGTQQNQQMQKQIQKLQQDLNRTKEQFLKAQTRAANVRADAEMILARGENMKDKAAVQETIAKTMKTFAEIPGLFADIEQVYLTMEREYADLVAASQQPPGFGGGPSVGLGVQPPAAPGPGMPIPGANGTGGPPQQGR